MSDPKNPGVAEEIRMGVANACLMMPATDERRAEEIGKLHELRDREKEAVADAKADVGLKDHAKRLTDVYGMSKPTLKIMQILDKVKAPGERAAILTQVSLLSQSVGYMDKDLVSLAQDAAASAGQQRDDQGSIFDKTSEGQRRGGSEAQPKHLEQKVEAAGPAPTPGLPLDEALRLFEAAKAEACWNGRGFMPKALKPHKAAVDEARAREEAAGEAQSETTGELPEAAPGEISASMREGNAAAEAHIRDQVEKRADEPPAAPSRSRVGKDKPADAKPVSDLDDELPPPAPKRGANRGLGPDAYH